MTTQKNKEEARGTYKNNDRKGKDRKGKERNGP